MVPVALPLWLAFPPVAIALAVLAASAVRRVHRAQRAEWEAIADGADGPAASARQRADGLQTARVLYYLGVGSVGLLVLRPAAGFTISDLFFFLALCATISVLIARRRQPDVALPPLVLIGVLTFTAGGLLTAFWAPSIGPSVSVIARVIYLATFWFWLGTVVLTEPKHIRTALSLVVVAAGLDGLGAVLQVVAHVQIAGAESAWGRSSGFTDHVNDLGGMAAFAITPALAIVHPRVGATRLQRLVVAICLPLILVGLLLSGSITGAMAAALAGGLWLIVNRAYVQAAAVLVVVAVAVSYLSVSSTNPYFRTPVQRLSQSVSRSQGENATFWSRMEANAAAWTEIERHPFVGVGLVPEDTVTASGHQVHNMLIKPWFEGGLFAMLGMAFIYAAAGTAGWRAVVRARTPAEHLIAVSLLLSYIAFLIWAMGQPQLFKRFGWMSGALILAVRAQQIRATRAAAASREDPAVAPAAARKPSVRSLRHVPSR